MPIPEKVYRRLLMLQNALVTHIPHVAGLNPRAYRYAFFSLSLSVPLLICCVNFYVTGRFSTPHFYHFVVGLPGIPQQPQSIFEGAHFGRF